jgi:Raf kinase inhibitor-like YbhB/YbcL family protein
MRYKLRFQIRTILLYCAAVSLVSLMAQRAEAASNLSMQSRAFANGSGIPVHYTCSGDSYSPPLRWSGVPSGSRSLALIVKDPDAPSGTFIHWVIYNLPADRSSLPGNMPTNHNIPGGGEQGLNSADEIGYYGPCPPPGSPHHYHFRLYALDTKLDLKPGASAAQVEDAMKGHVLAETDMVGIFGR